MSSPQVSFSTAVHGCGVFCSLVVSPFSTLFCSLHLVSGSQFAGIYRATWLLVVLMVETKQNGILSAYNFSVCPVNMFILLSVNEISLVNIHDTHAAIQQLHH